MKTTPTLLHATADYAMAGLLLIAPWLFGFSHDAAATSCTLAFGLTTLAYSLFTDYELSFRRVIPMSAHLMLDAVCGGLLIGAPFIMGYFHTVWVPHLVMGCVEVGFALGSALVLGAAWMVGHRQGHAVRTARGPTRRHSEM
jgi:hypothetical protein